MKPYRIAFLTSHPIQYQAPLFQYLAADPEVDLTVYFCWDFGVGKKSFDKEFRRAIQWDVPLLEGYNYVFLKNYSPRPGNTFFGHINIGIVRELYRNDYDAIILYGWYSLTNWIALIFAKIFGVKILLRGESPMNQELKKGIIKRTVKRLILSFFFRGVDSFLYIGKQNRKFFEYYNAPKAKLIFCPFAVDNKRFMQSAKYLIPQRDSLRAAHGIPDTSVVILFVGKLIALKRPMDILLAYERCSSDNTALLFVGSGPLENALKEYVDKHSVHGVNFIGFKNQLEIGAYYAMSDFLVIASDRETWGLVVNEAMCFGLPIVASSIVGCSSDLVHHGNNGYIFECGDIDEIARYISLLVTDEKKRTAFGNVSKSIINTYCYARGIEAIKCALKDTEL